jgi:hypothetical protein
MNACNSRILMISHFECFPLRDGLGSNNGWPNACKLSSRGTHVTFIENAGSKRSVFVHLLLVSRTTKSLLKSNVHDCYWNLSDQRRTRIIQHQASNLQPSESLYRMSPIDAKQCNIEVFRFVQSTHQSKCTKSRTSDASSVVVHHASESMHD